MQSLVLHYLTEWQTWGYLLIFIGMMIEGDALLFTVGFLTHQGYFSWALIILILFAGAIIGDILWYKLGAYLDNHDSFIIRWTNRLGARFDKHLKRQPSRTIFISKFAYGFHHALLIRAGVVGHSLRRLVKNDAIVTVFWIMIVGGLGYFAGASFLLFKHYLHYAGLALLFGIIFISLVSAAFTQVSRRWF